MYPRQFVFLFALLGVVVWFNRHRLGLGKTGCDWMGADTVAEDGTRKWMCQTCGAVALGRDGATPQECQNPHRVK